MKKIISTSKWLAKHPLAGWNAHHTLKLILVKTVYRNTLSHFIAQKKLSKKHKTFVDSFSCTISKYICRHPSIFILNKHYFVVTLLWSLVVNTLFAYFVWQKGYFHPFPLTVGISSPLILHHHVISKLFLFFT